MLDRAQRPDSSAATPLVYRREVQLLLVTAAVSAAAYAVTTLGPLQEAIRIALVLSDNQMALLQGPTRALPLMVCAVPLGLFIDRHSRVRLLFGFALLIVAASIGTALTTHFVLLLALRCLVGLGWAATLIASISFAADLYAPAERGRATMVMGVGQVGGASAAFWLGGPLLAAFGPAPSAWQVSMFWLTCPLALVTLSLMMLREPPRTGIAIRSSSAWLAFGNLWRYRAVIAPLLGGLVVVDIAFGAAYIWAAPVFSRQFGLSPDRVGAIMGMILLLSGLLGPITGGILADLCQRAGGPRRTIAVLCGLAFLSVPLGLFAVATRVMIASTVLVVFLTIVPAISLMTTTLCTIVIPKELHGLGIALLNAASVCFGYVLAPLAVSVLSGAIGGPSAIGKAVSVVCVTTSALGGAIFALGMRSFPRIVDP
jgi:predicted MFS family arabinose efflux permease